MKIKSKQSQKQTLSNSSNSVENNQIFKIVLLCALIIEAAF